MHGALRQHMRAAYEAICASWTGPLGHAILQGDTLASLMDKQLIGSSLGSPSAEPTVTVAVARSLWPVRAYLFAG